MKSNAFTLFEVLLAMGILTAAVSVIVTVQMRSMTRIMQDRDSIEKIFFIKKELFKFFLDLPKRPKKVVIKLEMPEMTITTQPDNIHAKSSLAPLKDRLYLLSTKGTWKAEQEKREATMVSFVFKPEPEKEKK